MRIRGPMTMLAGTLLLAACGGGTSSGASTPGAGGTPTAPVTDGGTLNIGLTQEPTSFLAAGITSSMTFSYDADAPVTEGLLWYRSVEETVNAKTLADYWRPDLATEVPTVENGDVKTSGCANAAARMCVTWKLFWLKYRTKNPTPILSTSGWDQAIDCTEDSPTRATVSYGAVYAPYLAIGTGVYGIMPSKQLDAAFTGDQDLTKVTHTVDLTAGSGNPEAYKGSDTLDKIIIGTGPYVLQKYEPTKQIVLVRNRNYWDKARTPHLDRLILVIKGDVQAQLTAVKAGELDMGLDYRLAFLKQLQDTAKQGRIAVETIPESGAEKIDVNACGSATAKGLCDAASRANPALGDPKFKHAMLEAINRQSIVDNIAAGATVIPQDTWFYLGDEYNKDPSIPTTAYDPTRSAADLDAAGYKLSPSCHGGQGRAGLDGRCLELDFVTTSGNPARAAGQLAVQADLQKVGIFTNISQIKSGSLFGSYSDGGILYNHTFDLAMYTNTLSVPADPDSYYAAYHGNCGGGCPNSNQIPSKANSGQGQNSVAENNPVVDKGLDDARASVGLKVRSADYKKVEKELAKDLPELPLYQQVVVNSYSTKLQGLQRNDIVWLFNSYDWSCTAGVCQA